MTMHNKINIKVKWQKLAKTCFCCTEACQPCYQRGQWWWYVV